MTPEQALAELKARLRRRQLERGLGMSGLELRAGLGHTTVSHALNGAHLPTEATVIRLAKALGTDPAPLLDLRDQAAPPRARPAKASFEDDYRSYLGRRHGQLSVVGLDLTHRGRARWPLDTAYLSLEFAVPARTAPWEVASRGAPTTETRIERAERALAGHHRVLVRGLAGSGKTTLLQWLTVSSARAELPDELRHLRDRVPFLLPLRTLVRRGPLPAPGGFLAAVGCPLADRQPEGWAHQLLAAGRALVLIDGLDEVPQERRGETEEWLRELLAAYPDASVAVTTRPSAVPEGWLADVGLAPLTVRPMSVRDVMVFVARWHAAAIAGTDDPDERGHLGQLRDQLTDTLRAQRDFTRLASTPLLSALLCALHRDRRGHLPDSRMELYEAALSMLLVRRDSERDIQAPEGIVLSRDASLKLLQRLAYWLIRNGQTELHRSVALALLRDALPSMPKVAEQGSAEQILEHLLARSGLLRAPATDAVDFVHRTFQDYLGARAALQGMDLPLLVGHGHDPQWEDVLRMAVAQARPDECATLLLGLIERGIEERAHRTRLQLLAAACLTHAEEVSPHVRSTVERHAARLLPPQDRERARELAEVGPLILDLLPGPGGLQLNEAEAVVHAAGLIGGDAALPLMKRFRTDERWQVRRELQDAWDQFDPGDYAREVLAHLPALDHVLVSTPEQLAVLRQLSRIAGITLRGDFSASALIAALTPDHLVRLDILDNDTLRSLNWVSRLPRLDSLNLRRCPAVEDLSPLADSAIRSLTLVSCASRAPAGLARVGTLRELALHTSLAGARIGSLAIEAPLTELALHRGIGRGVSLAGIGRWPTLGRVTLGTTVTAIQELAELPALRHLRLQGSEAIGLLAERPELPQVTRLTLNTRLTVDLGAVRVAFPRLSRLVIVTHPGVLVDLRPLRDLPDLRIHVTGGGNVDGAGHFPPDAVTFA
ncbi:NACHT domain-containing protein [Streptomyces profundus]|uniref:NACHT domain-containing protein n=1 Tax=Streptomyces profundus TaxID=2867410 RepID=UPI001D169245|nr:NACHT domain-containing protein [Streptomyces sp. MA3_2.13]UED87369.1 NACHT domain-containing protein [Streptomyces sp. MA3_2.13]